MPTILLATPIHAAPAVVFDLTRSIDLHRQSMGRHREEAVAGVASGLIGPGETVRWRAHHFGVWFELTSKIVAFDPPRHFRDSMVEGPFAGFDHDHHFDPTPDGTLMRDVFAYRSPLGPLGRLADRLFLERYVTNLLAHRNQVIKEVAELGLSQRQVSPRGNE